LHHDILGHFLLLRGVDPRLTTKLDLPSPLVGVHDVFDVLQLKKCLKTPMDVIINDKTPLEEDLTYPEHRIKLLDQEDCVLRC
jgi:hypothetical protein